MALTKCPDCGAQVAANAVVCAQCGFPLRHAVQARPARFSGDVSRSNNNGVVVFFVAAGMFVVLMLGEIDYGAVCGHYGGDTTAVEVDATVALRRAYRGIATWQYEHQRMLATE